MKYYLGMDIGGTKCSVVLSEKNAASIKDKLKFETRVERGYNEIIAELIDSAHIILNRNNINTDDVIACGISCGGPLDSDRGIIMCPPNLSDWDNVPLADMVSQSLGIPCKVRNDADACALAEWQFGAGKGTENMIFLTFGTGMGAGLILNGRLYSGSCGTAGEVGHIRLDANGPAAYGKAGSFEGFCSGTGIAITAKKMLSIYNVQTIIPKDNVTAKTVADAAANGDKLANSIYRRCGEKLGLGISILIDILNPEKIVIGSIYQRSGFLLADAMNETIKKEALEISAKHCEIVPAMLGDDIGDFAAIGVAKDYAEDRK